MSRWVVVPALAVCAAAMALFVPFLTEQRELVASTPSPRPLFMLSFVEIPPRERLCVAGVTIPKEAEQLRVQVGTFGRPGPALEIDLSAPGYRERLAVPAGYADSAVVRPALDPPPADRLGRVCVAHRGRQRIALVGTTEERTRSRPAGRLGATPVEADAYLAFYERGSASALDRSGEIVGRMSAFRPAVVGPWLVWPVLALAVVGVPAGVVLAALRAARA